MVKISLKPVSAQKPDKENDEEKIAIPQAHVSLHTFVLNGSVLDFVLLPLPQSLKYLQSSALFIAVRCVSLGACSILGMLRAIKQSPVSSKEGFALKSVFVRLNNAYHHIRGKVFVLEKVIISRVCPTS